MPVFWLPRVAPTSRTSGPPGADPEPTTNLAPVDVWTLVHAATGFAAGAVGLRPVVAIGGAAIYELLEYAHEYPSGSRLFGSIRPESSMNVTIDMAAFIAGYLAGRR